MHLHVKNIYLGILPLSFVALMFPNILTLSMKVVVFKFARVVAAISQLESSKTILFSLMKVSFVLSTILIFLSSLSLLFII
jgi:hypothetical protein